jgi:hypothetical protein
MKKTIFFAVVLVALSALNSNAGDKIGIRAGYQMASFHVDGSMLANTDNLNSFYMGIFKENQLIPLLKFGYGLDYLQNGAELSDFGKYKLNYLSIPLYVKAKIGPVFGLAGTGLNFKISDKLENGGMETDADDNYATKDFDMPLFIGGGFKILMVTIEARYNWGLIDINETLGIKNQYWQIGASLSF